MVEFNSSMDKFAYEDTYNSGKQPENATSSGVENSQPKKKTMNVFASLDNNLDSTVEYTKDGRAKNRIDSNINIFEESNLSSMVKQKLSIDTNSLWENAFNNYSISYNNSEISYMDEDDRKELYVNEASKIDEGIESQIKDKISKVNSDIQNAYNEALNKAQKEVEKEKLEQQQQQLEQKEENNNTDKNPISSGLITTTGKVLEDVVRTTNIYSEIGDYASKGLEIVDSSLEVSKNTLAENSKYLKKVKTVSKYVAKTAIVLDSALTAYNTYEVACGENGKFLEDDNGNFDEEAAEKALKTAGRGAGSIVGASVGASIGSAVPVVGTAVGGYVGGKVGGEFGEDIAETSIKAKDIVTDDSISGKDKSLEIAKLGHELQIELQKDVINVTTDVANDATNLLIDYASPLASAKSVAISLGDEETAKKIETAQNLIKEGKTAYIDTVGDVANASISILNGDAEGAKKELLKAEKNMKTSVRAGDRLIKGTAHEVKNEVKKTLKSVKLTVNPKSNSTIDNAKRTWNKGVDKVYSAGSNAYHTATNGYNKTKQYLKNGYRIVRGWVS